MRIGELLRTWRVVAGQVYAQFIGAIIAGGPIGGPLATLAYSATPTPDASLANAFVMTITNNSAFQFQAPLNPPPVGTARLSITIANTSGGAHGAGTFVAGANGYRVSAAVPVIANNQQRTLEFQWNGTAWVEVFRTAADVPV